MSTQRSVLTLSLVGLLLLLLPALAWAADEDAETAETAEQACKIERIRLGFWSLLFTAVPLMVGMAVFLWLVTTHGGSEKFQPFFGDGKLVQLLVIIVVAGNVCSLALMDILKNSEVAAIYGGIVGYVLGKRMAPSEKPKPKPEGGDGPGGGGGPGPEAGGAPEPEPSAPAAT
ncbi:MAG: hypothetical protein ACYTG6_03340 [Planctomycetota bacterium]|jgi:hypothetical protein